VTHLVTHLVGPAVALALTIAFLGIAGWWRRRDPRRWRIGVALTAAGWLAAVALLQPLDALDGPLGDGVVALTLPWAVSLVVGTVLVVNGARLVGPEGRTLGTLLSFVVGVAMTGVTALGVALVWFGAGSGTRAGAGSTALPAVCLVVLLLPGYPALVIVSYLLYCVAYLRRAPRPAPVAIVVLGSGLVGGQVPRLLAHRLDAALALLRAEEAHGRCPLLVPSGGQGEDEPVSEGAAMTAYLLDRGVDPARIVTEDRATTTEENLVRSLRLLEERGVTGRLRVVTSSYHAGRAALLTRRLGIDADVSPARTPWSFLPSAFLREVAAAVTHHPWVNAVGLLLWVASSAGAARAVAG
jgi:uncharacterized SAM-binding protein YcdF (DUF218 family)